MEDNIERILVTRLKYMGDVVMSTSLLKNLRAHFPGAKISYLTNADYAPLLENDPNVDQVVSIHSEQPVRELIARLREQRFDISIDLLGNSRSAVLTRAIAARRRLGPSGVVQKFCYTDAVAQAHQISNAVSKMLAYLKPLDLPVINFRPELQVSQEEAEWADMYLRSGGIDFEKPIVGINPGGRWPNKLWPFENYIELTNKLVDDGWQVVFTQDYLQGPLLQRIMDEVYNSVICADFLPIRRQAGLLSKFDLFVGNYSGMVHLAAAVGVVTIALIGPDDPATSFPYAPNSGHRAIYHTVSCRDYCTTECPFGTLDCLNAISVQSVFNAVQGCRPISLK